MRSRPLAVVKAGTARAGAAAICLAMLLVACGGSGADLGSGPRPDGSTSTSSDGGVASTVPDLTTVPAGSGTGTGTGAGGTGPTAPPTSAAPSPTAPPPPGGLAAVSLKLSRVATFTEPEAMAVRSGDGALYVAEKRGRVRAIRGSSVDPTPVLDIAGDVGTGTEQGLFGLAFSADGSKLYVDYTDNTSGSIHVVEFGMVQGGRADPSTRREILVINKTAPNHNGGNLAFGPDGDLWIGVGDGGGAGDPSDNAQNLGTLLGKVLRIDPRPDIAKPYTVPPDNPFVNTPGARPEIWAYGLRNPVRFSFDKATGDLWLGDQGENAREEIDLQPGGTRGGQNYGWARLEGTRPYKGVAPDNAVPPLTDYGHANGNCAVIGGYVYRGGRIPGLVGDYLYGDYCVGQIQALRQSGGQVVDQRTFNLFAKPLTAFGQDNSGELYALSQDGGVFKIEAG